jgi:hypothetical protein
MNVLEKRTFYFSEAGEQNTDTLLKLVKDHVKKEGIKDIVVASTTGKTGAKAANILKGYNVVVVTHNFGFKEPGKTEVQEEFRNEILARGANLHRNPCA